MSWQCDNCGFRVNGGVDEDIAERHECHPDGIVRTQAALIDAEFAAFLATPQGRFAVHYARRELGEAA